MAKKVILRDLNDNKILPITRGELILDSSGMLAFHSNEFLATDSLPGLMSVEDKIKIKNLSGGVDFNNEFVTLATNQTITGIKTFTNLIKFSGEDYPHIAGNGNYLRFSYNGEDAKSLLLGKTDLATRDDNVLSLGNTDSRWSNIYTYSINVANSVLVNGKSLGDLAFKNSLSFSEITSKPTTLAGYGISNAWEFMYNTNYVACNFRDSSLAKHAADKYIEFWDAAGGWFNFKAGKYIVQGGTSSQFLKADGSLDSTAYLPLSGGTVKSSSGGALAIDRTGGGESYIKLLSGGTYKGAVTVGNATYGASIYNAACGKYMGIKDDGTPHYHGNTLIHSGNIGSQSVSYATSAGSADTLEGQNGNWYRANCLRFARTNKTNNNSEERDANVIFDRMLYNYGSVTYWKNAPTNFQYGQILALSSYGDNSLAGQLAWDVNHNSTTDTTRSLWWRATDAGDWIDSQWHKIAFTDSNVASADYATSAGNATKLATARLIWGQSFDGTGNVSGNLLLGKAIILGYNGKGLIEAGENSYAIGYGYRENPSSLWASTFKMWANSATALFINSSGNTTLGSNNDLATTNYKLYVNGNSYVNGHSYVKGKLEAEAPYFGYSGACDVWLRRENGYSYINAVSSIMMTVGNSSANYAFGISADKSATLYGSLTVSGQVIATTFIGNIDGQYVNKLTGYAIATSASNLSTTDTLNSALGKLEYKVNSTYNWYQSVTGTDTDNVINKWHEIVDFVNNITTNTDLTNEFVTRKTAQTISGAKTFTATTNTFGGGDSATYLTVDRNSTNPAYVCFKKNGNLVGYLGVSNDKIPVFNDGNGPKTILHSGNYSTTLDGRYYTETEVNNLLKNYLPLAGGTMTLGEGLKFHSDSNYFGKDLDARIISLLDGNGTTCDGGLIIDERATNNGTETITELLRIRDSEFKWRGNNILHAGNYASYLGYIGTTAVQKSGAALALTGITTATFSGAVTLSGTTVSTAILKFSRSGASAWNYIIWPGDTDADCKLAFGYSNTSSACYYYMTNTSFNPVANNARSLGTSSARWSNVYSVLGNFTGNVTLYSASGDSPHLYFLRGTTSDGTYDWDMFVTGGNLTLRQNNAGTWNTALTAADNYMSTGWRFNVGKELSVKDQRFNYSLAYYNANFSASTVTGTIVITLPKGWISSMNTYEIDIYEYNGYTEAADNVLHSKLIIDGYNYESGSWHNYGYTQIGSYNKGVRLGYNGSKCVIMLGTTSTTWSYPQVHLSRVITGYNNQTDWSTGYSISVITSESGYSAIVTANRLRLRFADVVANTFRGTLSGRATSVGDGTMIMYPYANNEVNFGGSSSSTTLYFGYRATDSRPIPSNFVFGGNGGTATLTATKLTSSLTTSTHINGNKGTAIINSTAAAGYNMLAKMNSTNGVFNIGTYNAAFELYYTKKDIIDAGTNSYTYEATLLNESGNSIFPGLVSVNTLKITNTSAVAHIAFSRGSYNYITAPTGGFIGFCVNGNAAAASANCEMVISDGAIFPGTSNVTSLGDNSHRWSNIYSVSGNFTGIVNMSSRLRIVGTTATPTWDSAGAITWSESASDSQPVSLVYTSYDSYRAPAGLKLMGSQGGEWFEVVGNIYGAGFVKSGSSDSYVLLGGGGHKTIASFQTTYDSRYVKKAGDTMTGRLTMSTTITDHSTPIEQCLVINSYAIPEGTTLTLKNSPGIGFHIANKSWGSLVFNGNFNFINNDATSFLPVKASKFITNGGTSSLFVKGDGSLDSNTYLTSHQSLANYVTLNTALTISGVKTFSTLLKFTVALGTAPFTITSTTKVTNLNADLLDGYSASGIWEYGTSLSPYNASSTGWYLFLTLVGTTNDGQVDFVVSAAETGTNLGVADYFHFATRPSSTSRVFVYTHLGVNNNYLRDNIYVYTDDNKTYRFYMKYTSAGTWNWFGKIKHISSRGCTLTYSNTWQTAAPSGTAYLATFSGAVNYASSAGTANSVSWSSITGKPSSYYSLPLAASGTRGGIQIGYTDSGANIALKLSSEKGYVTLTKTAVTTALGYTPPSSDTNTWRPLSFNSTSYSGSGVNFTGGTGISLSVGAADSGGQSTVTISPLLPKSGSWFNDGLVKVSTSGVAEIGRYIDFHPTNTSTLDYSVRIDSGTSTTARTFTLGTTGGTLAITADNNKTGNTTTTSKIYPVGTTSTSTTAGNYAQTYTNTNFYVNSSGVFWTSDRKFKDCIKSPVKNGMLDDETGLIRKFNWKDTGKSSYGFIAQELLPYVPEAVDYDEELNKYSVNYDVAHSALIAQLIIKVKELEEEILRLKQLIN